MYRTEGVRALQVIESATIRTSTGDKIVTVWQRLEDQNKFAVQLAALRNVDWWFPCDPRHALRHRGTVSIINIEHGASLTIPLPIEASS